MFKLTPRHNVTYSQNQTIEEEGYSSWAHTLTLLFSWVVVLFLTFINSER